MGYFSKKKNKPTKMERAPAPSIEIPPNVPPISTLAKPDSSNPMRTTPALLGSEDFGDMTTQANRKLEASESPIPKDSSMGAAFVMLLVFTHILLLLAGVGGTIMFTKYKSKK